MAKKLRLKFIVISMISVIIGITIIGVAINFVNYQQVNYNSENALAILRDNNGVVPRHEPNQNIRYFTVYLDETNNIENIRLENVNFITNEVAQNLTTKVLSKGSSKGIVDDFKYEIVEKEDSKTLVFVHYGREREMINLFIKNTLIISLIALFIVFILILLLSKKIISPVIESYTKQKQFITNASHELKTPLTAIYVNTEALEIEQGQCEMTNNIKHQTDKLVKMVEDLVLLSRMDEESKLETSEKFNYTMLLNEVIDDFLFMALHNNKEIKVYKQDDVFLNADSKIIEKLLRILFENAVKYAPNESEITVDLIKGSKESILSITNQTNKFSKGQHPEIFERFYRADKSRNSEIGGHGIGLSIAKAIVTKYNGKITAESMDGKSITIKVKI